MNDLALLKDLSLFYGPNAGYVLDLYDRYCKNPSLVDDATQTVFRQWDLGNGATHTRPQDSPLSPQKTDINKIAGAVRLALLIRTLGHRAAAINPLQSQPAEELQQLIPRFEARLGARLEAADLAALPAEVIGGPLSEGCRNALEALNNLRRVYSGPIGYENDHVQDDEERLWLFDAIESGRFFTPLSAEEKRHVLVRLTEVETFERYLHTTFVGQKRFSLEGTDMVIPMLDLILHHAASAGMREVLIGMAHRGRLNVLTHILGKPYAAILSEFHAAHGEDEEPSVSGAGSHGWTGDVKYHMGGRTPYSEPGVHEMPVTLAPNPSHLEVVNPVILGRARAAQERRGVPGFPLRDSRAAGAILIHGDAAFPGQGIVAETLNLSQLQGYSVGGTLHIILNNQIGFTTSPGDSRSTLYSSDLAKGFEIPIVHVNADDSLACIAAAEMAYAYCSKFHKDFLIDLVGYRRWGHNEADEPAYTQPRLYEFIAAHPTVRELWARKLEQDQVLAPGEAEKVVTEIKDRLEEARHNPAGDPPVGYSALKKPVASSHSPIDVAQVSAQRLTELNEELLRVPEGFSLHPKLERTFTRRKSGLHEEGGIDWGHAETLAFASLLADGVPIRLSGQDVERGTFSHRHLVWHDPHSGETYTPLQNFSSAHASFGLYNSPLSENAVLGFEYGYSMHAQGTLVLWEAQFGDFSNSAQVIIDQFLVSGQAKWRQAPSLVLLLPHGLEGQGPEHSSGRLERFLQLCANDNLRVVNCTTAAQYFHVLRRQAALLETAPRPLIIMSPKSLLRHPRAAVSLSDLAGGTFRPVLDDPLARQHADQVTRVVLCSGKVYVDLVTNKAYSSAEKVAVVRIEELYPFPYRDLRSVLSGYPNLRQIDWLQEEPQNMGAWTYIAPLIRNLVGGSVELSYLGRSESASPAEGSHRQHVAEQARILAAGLLAAPD
jgi:2-oxoglutarate dehydrogenase E1 component